MAKKQSGGLAVAEPAQAALIEIPLAEPVGYAPRRLDVELTGAQAEAIKRVAAAIGKSPARAVAHLADLIAAQQ